MGHDLWAFLCLFEVLWGAKKWPCRENPTQHLLLSECSWLWKCISMSWRLIVRGSDFMQWGFCDCFWVLKYICRVCNPFWRYNICGSKGDYAILGVRYWAFFLSANSVCNFERFDRIACECFHYSWFFCLIPALVCRRVILLAGYDVFLGEIS